RPRATVRAAIVCPGVVLLEEGAVSGGVPGELVHALAPLRILVRKEFGPDAAVLGRPRPPGIPHLQRTDRAHPDHEVPRIARVDEHGVETHTSASRLPVLPRREAVQALDVPPRLSTSVT